MDVIVRRHSSCSSPHPVRPIRPIHPVSPIASRPHVASPLLSAVVFAACIPTAATLADGANFSNNLFSDLGPILGLFGEQVAKQFMAGSLGWSDNILFAMAPLGIITAIIGAIRIGGPEWLKTIVGRARENRPAAEVELTTSTSSNVCELWNGRAVVRMTGAPKIVQLLYFLPLQGEDGQHVMPEDTLFTVPMARKLEHDPLEEKQDSSWGTSFVALKPTDIPKQIPRPTRPDEESQKADYHTRHTASTGPPRVQVISAPNVSLNLRPRRNKWELRLFAAFGIALQTGVFVFSGFVTYNGKLQSHIGGAQSFSYGYPLAATGTFVLVMGMLVCAFVVEASTREIRYMTPKGRNFHILWLQQGENVNDQIFDSYAIFAEKARDSVMTSCLVDHNDPNVNPGSKLYTETLAIIGTVAGVVGFIIQFTGLRGMNWSASVAQLVATLIMTVVRTVVRRGMATAPHTQKIPHRHELDWLATRFAHPGDREKLWPSKDTVGADPREGIAKGDDNLFWSEDCWDWKIVTASDTTEYRFYLLTDVEKDRIHGRTHSHDVFRIREHIGRLSKWTATSSSAAAVSLANAIEIVMNSFPIARNASTELKWPMRGLNGDLIFLTVAYKKNRWRASAAEIDALLSLWIYAAETDERRTKDEMTDKSASKSEIKTHVSNEMSNKDSAAADCDDWLRDGDEALRQTNIRLLGPIEPKYIRDLMWYIGDGMDVTEETEELPELHPLKDGYSDGTSDTNAILPTEIGAVAHTSQPGSQIDDSIGGHVRIGRNRVVGFASISQSSSNVITTQPHYRRFQLPQRDRKEYTLAHTEPGHTPNNLATERGKRLLAIRSDIPIDQLFVQDMFSTFMWAVANEMKQLSGNTTIYPSDGDWRTIRLENSVLSRAAKEIERAAGQHLGSLEDIYFSIIPPLNQHQKLPIPSCLLEYSMAVADNHEAIGHWEEAAEVYLWLFRKCIEFGPEHQLGVRATAALWSFRKAVIDTRDIFEGQQQDPEEIKAIKNVESSLGAGLGDAALSVVTNLKVLEECLSEDRKFEGFEGATQLHKDLISEGDWWWKEMAESKALSHRTDILGLAPFHYAALKGMPNAVRYLLKCGHDHNCADSAGRTPLHYAVSLGHEEIVRSLSVRRATQNGATAQDLSGRTPLHYARKESIAWALLQEGARLDIQGRDGTAALHCVARNGLFEITKIFVEAGANVDVMDNLRRTPLHWAAYCGKENIVDLLVKKGASTTARDDHGRIPLHLAAVADKLTKTMFQFLKAKEEDLNTSDRRGLTALHLAAMAGKMCSTKLLLEELGGNNTAKDRDKRTALHWAACNGHEATVRVLIDFQADVESRDNKGSTPLHCAAMNGHGATVRVLIEDFKADVEAKDNRGWTPLHLAASNGHEATVRVLIGFQADVEPRDNKGSTPLHCAAMNGHEATARVFIEHFQADVEAKDHYGLTPLHWAARNGREGMVRVLIEDFKADVESRDNDGLTPLHWAASEGNEAAVRVLIGFKADVEARDKNGCTPLYLAARNRREATVRVLIEDGKADVEARDKDGCTPLYWAAMNRREGMVRVLIEDGKADVEVKGNNGWTPLHLAAMNRHEAMVRVLIEDGKAEVKTKDKDGWTPLHRAVIDGREATVRMLIEDGKADVEAKDNDGCTPLHLAARYGHTTIYTEKTIVSLLIEDFQADVKAQDNKGRTPLHWAASEGNEATVRELIGFKADVEARDKNGCTPLYLAAMRRREATVRVLIEDGKADVGAKDNNGQTPLHRAASEGNEATVRLLISFTADVEATDNDGLTPLHLAARYGHTAIYNGNGNEATVRVLIEDLQADVAAIDNKGRTPLHWAASEGNEVAACVLIGFKADVEAKDNDGCTPLHLAARYRHTTLYTKKTTVSLLIEDFQADVKAQDNKGRAPLHWAASEGNEATARELIGFKADIEATDNDEKTPLDIADECGHKEMIERILADSKTVHNSAAS